MSKKLNKDREPRLNLYQDDCVDCHIIYTVHARTRRPRQLLSASLCGDTAYTHCNTGRQTTTIRLI